MVFERGDLHNWAGERNVQPWLFQYLLRFVALIHLIDKSEAVALVIVSDRCGRFSRVSMDGGQRDYGLIDSKRFYGIREKLVTLLEWSWSTEIET